jgi:hypothetical protein
MSNLRDILKEGLVCGSSLHRDLLGNLGLLRAKENAYLDSSSVDPEDIKS